MADKLVPQRASLQRKQHRFRPSLFPEGPREEYREAICIDSLHSATRCIRMHLVGGALNPQDSRVHS